MNIKQLRSYVIRQILPPVQNFYAALMQTGQSWSRYWGDDGTYQKGVNIWGSRFTDNGDGTVSDSLTGLMWVRDPSQLYGAFGNPGSPYQMYWNDAINNCENLDYAGYQDWRLPNIRELESLINYGYAYPAINTMWFSNIQSMGSYWTSTVYQPYDYYAWIVNFYDGGRSSYPRDYMYQNYVLPVRGGQ